RAHRRGGGADRRPGGCWLRARGGILVAEAADRGRDRGARPQAAILAARERRGSAPGEAASRRLPQGGGAMRQETGRLPRDRGQRERRARRAGSGHEMRRLRERERGPPGALRRRPGGAELRRRRAQGDRGARALALLPARLTARAGQWPTKLNVIPSMSIPGLVSRMPPLDVCCRRSATTPRPPTRVPNTSAEVKWKSPPSSSPWNVEPAINVGLMLSSVKYRDCPSGRCQTGPSDRNGRVFSPSSNTPTSNRSQSAPHRRHCRTSKAAATWVVPLNRSSATATR